MPRSGSRWWRGIRELRSATGSNRRGAVWTPAEQRVVVVLEEGRLRQRVGINDYHRKCLSVVQAIRIGDLMPAPGRQPSPGSVAANLSSVLAMAVATVSFVAAGALALVFVVFATAAHAIGQKLALITKDESGEPVDSMWLGLLPFLLVVVVCFGLSALVTVTR
jgi:hypothetical protein